MYLKKNLVSVIMSNYNTDEEYLREAIESILNQSYAKFEFIIVDDCSNNNSIQVINSYNDPRIKLIKNSKNLGITKSLNIALEVATGEFVARMDADDVSLRKRFEKQVEFLKKHSDVIVCGTGVELFGDGANRYHDKYVQKIIPKKEEFQIHLLFGNHVNIIHPTAMFNRELMIKHKLRYDENYIYAQDYKMWVDCSRVGECRNLEEILLRYRIHDKAVSNDRKNIQMDCTKRIMGEQLKWIDLELPDNWENIHFGMLVGRKKYNLHYKEWICLIIRHNEVKHVFDSRELKRILWAKWAEITYYELYKAPINKKIEILSQLPIRYFVELINIRKRRTKKEE